MPHRAESAADKCAGQAALAVDAGHGTDLAIAERPGWRTPRS
ncbi:hypothetical protein ABZ599_18165 [Streptomyces misionensis]